MTLSFLLSPDGVFVLPSSTPGFLIVEFLTGGLEEASRRMNEARSVKSEEANLIFRCINELGLIQLDRDDMISPQQMISCCSSLLKAASRIRSFAQRSSCLTLLLIPQIPDPWQSLGSGQILHGEERWGDLHPLGPGPGPPAWGGRTHQAGGAPASVASDHVLTRQKPCACTWWDVT